MAPVTELLTTAVIDKIIRKFSADKNQNMILATGLSPEMAKTADGIQDRAFALQERWNSQEAVLRARGKAPGDPEYDRMQKLYERSIEVRMNCSNRMFGHIDSYNAEAMKD